MSKFNQGDRVRVYLPESNIHEFVGTIGRRYGDTAYFVKLDDEVVPRLLGENEIIPVLEPPKDPESGNVTLSDYHVISDSGSGTFAVRYDGRMHSFTFQMTVIDYTGVPHAVHSSIKADDADMLARFLSGRTDRELDANEE